MRLITTSYTHFRLDGGISITTPEITPEQAIVEANDIIDAHFFTEEERQAWAQGHLEGAARRTAKSSCAAACWPPMARWSPAPSRNSRSKSMHPGQRATQQVTVPKPRLWSDSTPELYRLRSTLALDGRTLDETTTTFGIRQLKFDPDRGLFVNGKPTKLKGVCLHQDAGSFGNAVPTAVWAWRLARLKEMGCNAIRTEPSPVRAGVLRPVRSARLLRLR